MTSSTQPITTSEELHLSFIQKEAVLEKQKTEIKKKPLLRILAHLLPKCLLSSTPVCKHDHGCFENVIEGALNQFIIGFAF